MLLQEMGHDVVSAEGFAETWAACEDKDAYFDLVILGHSISPKDKGEIIAHIKQRFDCPILALLRSNEDPLISATRSVEVDPDEFLTAVRQLLESE